jgi:predicted membrane protein
MDQETAIEMLRERYAHGGLPLEEFRRLMGKLLVTTDPAECQALLDDLPPAPPMPPAEEPAAQRTLARRETDTWQRQAGEAPASQNVHHIMAMFGSINRSDVLWDLGPELQATALFGEVKLDVRMARLVEGENVLRVHAIFGEVKLTIPEGMDVTIHSTAQFGDVSTPRQWGRWGEMGGRAPATSAQSTAGRRLRIYATATFGQVSIRTV